MLFWHVLHAHVYTVGAFPTEWCGYSCNNATPVSSLWLYTVSEYSKVSPLPITDTNFLFKMFPLFSLISPFRWTEFWSCPVKFHIKPKWNLGWYCIEFADYIGGRFKYIFLIKKYILRTMCWALLTTEAGMVSHAGSSSWTCAVDRGSEPPLQLGWRDPLTGPRRMMASVLKRAHAMARPALCLSPLLSRLTSLDPDAQCWMEAGCPLLPIHNGPRWTKHKILCVSFRFGGPSGEQYSFSYSSWLIQHLHSCESSNSSLHLHLPNVLLNSSLNLPTFDHNVLAHSLCTCVGENFFIGICVTHYALEGNKHAFWIRATWVWILITFLLHCVALGKMLNLSGPPLFTHKEAPTSSRHCED